MTSLILHYSLHFFLPLIIAILFFKKEWKKVYVIMLLTMIVDLDHLLANPIFDPNRCSINLHPLHTYYAMTFYVILIFLRTPLNIIGTGLVLHMTADFVDCLIMYSNCNECFLDSPAIEILIFFSKFSENWL